MDQSEHVPDPHQWETSKENVVPLREGRDAKELNKALTLSDSEIEKIRQTHLAAIKATENSDDPLEAWDQYAKWAVKYYPAGSPNITHSVEVPCRKYAKNPLFKHDFRLVRLWVRYAQIRTDKLDAYEYMRKHGIGEKCALVYEAWAAQLEILRNYDEAEKVYKLGIEKRAEPIERLQQRESEFHKRCVARAKREKKKKEEKAIEKMVKEVNNERDVHRQKSRSRLVDEALAENDEPVMQGRQDNDRRFANSDENQEGGRFSRKKSSEMVRPALGTIDEEEASTGLRPQVAKSKSKSKKKGLGLSSSSGLKTAKSGASSSQRSNIKVEVFREKKSSKDGPSFDDNLDDEMPDRILPTADAVQKENDGIPTQWAGETLKQNMSQARKRQAAAGGMGESFQVYEGSDDENQNEMDESLRITPFVDEDDAMIETDTKPKGLSLRKRENDLDEAPDSSGADASKDSNGEDMLAPPSPTINTRIAMQALDESLNDGSGPMAFLKQSESTQQSDTGSSSKRTNGFGGRERSQKLFKSSSNENEDEKQSGDMTINTKMAMEAVEKQFNAPPPSLVEHHRRNHDEDVMLDEDEIVPDVKPSPVEAPKIEIFQDDVAVPDDMGRADMDGFKIHEDIEAKSEAVLATPQCKDEEEALGDFLYKWTQGEPRFSLLASEDPTELEKMFDLEPGKQEGQPEQLISLNPNTLVRGARNKSIVVLAEDLDNAYDLRKPTTGGAKNGSDSDSDSDDDDEEPAQVTLKVSDHLNLWEFYIYRTLETRGGGAAQCKSIATALACYEGKENSYLALDRVCFASIHDLMKSFGLLYEGIAMLFAIDLLRAVEFTHRCNVIHTDITLANILYRNDDEDRSGVASEYSLDPRAGWTSQGVLLIDFYDAIDAYHDRVGPDLVDYVTKHVGKRVKPVDERGWGFNIDCHSTAGVIAELVGKGPELSEDDVVLKFEDVWDNAIQQLRSLQATDGPHMTVKTMAAVRTVLEETLAQDRLLKVKMDKFIAKTDRLYSKHLEGGKLWKSFN